MKQTSEITAQEDYTIQQKYRIFKLLNEEKQFLIKDYGLKYSSDKFLSHISNVISKFIDNNGRIYYEKKKFVLFDEQITPKTLANFLQSDVKDLYSVHSKTVRFLDVYLKITNIEYREGAISDIDNLRSLIKLTSALYIIDGDKNFAKSISRNLKDKEGSYILFSGPRSWERDDIHGFINLKYVTGTKGFVCNYVRTRSVLKNTRFDKAETEESDWMEDRYCGIAVRTVSGIFCQIRSILTYSPIFIMIQSSYELKEPDNNTENDDIIHMYITDNFTDLRAGSKTDDVNIEKIFDNMIWMI